MRTHLKVRYSGRVGHLINSDIRRVAHVEIPVIGHIRRKVMNWEGNTGL